MAYNLDTYNYSNSVRDFTKTIITDNQLYYDSFENPDLEIWKTLNVHYCFHNHFHPYVGELIQRLNKGELAGLMETNYKIVKEDLKGYYPNDENKVKFFPKEIELAHDGAYSLYNWELFFHIPLAIAVQLSKNQKFKEAQKWFHFIFDPTTDEPVEETNPTKRFWKFKHFRENTKAELITEKLQNLANGNSDPTLIDSLEKWRETPFNPHIIAQIRPLAYQFNVVMKYLDNLIAWGDSLFRQFTIETLNEATQMYVLAANILGEKPQEIPKLTKRPRKTYAQLKRNGTFDKFGNILTEMENEFPLNTNLPGVTSNRADSTRINSIHGISNQLFFCIPRNKKLLEYWDTLSDRLYKIRHCMDIEGNIRQIPLFQPQIDPGMLVKAANAGLNIGDIISGLNQPISYVRYNVILQKAIEICVELRSMGNSLLSAIEKRDSEKLSLIRQQHEIKMLDLSKEVRYLQWKESENATASLLKTRESAFLRYRHYQILLGNEEEDFTDLSEIVIERSEITEENFEEVHSDLVGKYGQEIDLEEYAEDKLGLIGQAASMVSGIVGAVDSALGVGSSDHLKLNKTEDIELNVLMPLTSNASLFSGAVRAAAGILSAIPQFDASGRPLGVGAGVGFGGVQLSSGVNSIADGIKNAGEVLAYQANRAGKLGSYLRRINDWILQNNLASKELEQIGNQLISSLIREQITKKEYENHKIQMEHSSAIDDFLKEQKFTTEELYFWMQGEYFNMFNNCYKMAFDIAKKAEVTMKHELMRPELNERDFIKFNYWDGGRRGLLSGEALFLDLKRMELAAIEANKREFELTKHISLKQLNPMALLNLKAKGVCEMEIPEWLFDLDCPGHFMRRIKSMSVSIPCIAGPYTSVNCTLSLQKSSLRKSSVLSDGYERDSSEDDRFKDYFGVIQSIVTSNAQNDSGLFEVNFNEQRFLPFEGAGVISTWKLELPNDFRQFDFNTISDVILHLKFTARQGGQILKTRAIESLKIRIEEIETTGLTRLFSLRHDFPSEWHKFQTSDENFKAKIKKEHFSYLTQGKDFGAVKISLQKIDDDSNLSVINDGVVSELDDILEALNASDVNEAEIEIKKDVINDGKEFFMIVDYTL